MSKRVLMVATGRKTRGGITSVLKAYESTPLWKDYHCKWIETHRDCNSAIKALYFIRALVQYVALLPFYDIVHIHFSMRTTAIRKRLFMTIAKFYRKKTIIHLHCGSQIHEIWNHNYVYMFKSCDKAILLSKNLQTMVEEHTGLDKKYTVLYNPCLNGVKKISMDNRKNEILFAGTLYENKGYRDLIRAFGKIAKEYPEWNLVLAGNGEVELGKQLASDCGCINQVKFLGWVAGADKDKAFREASVFCLPSYAEGFPMAVLDAFSYGLPVVTTPVGGIPDIAEEGKNMLLFEPGDVDTLAHKLKMLIDDDNLRKSLSDASSLLAATTFDLDHVTSNLASIYDSI